MKYSKVRKCGCDEEFKVNRNSRRREYIEGHRRRNPERYFWQYVPRVEDSKCWEWTGGTANKGYGSFSVEGKKVGAHRFSWDLHNPLNTAKDRWVLHRCDNPPCVNPNHLFLGDNELNVRDMWEKGRGYTYWKDAPNRDSNGHLLPRE